MVDVSQLDVKGNSDADMAPVVVSWTGCRHAQQG